MSTESTTPALDALIAVCVRANHVTVAATHLQRGDVVTDNMGSYYLITEQATVSDTWDSRALIWVRTRVLIGIGRPDTVRHFRYELNDDVLTVHRGCTA